MKRRGYDNKRDGNEVAIVKAFEAAGALVWRLDQPADLLVCIQEMVLLVEVKRGRAKLNSKQIETAKLWPINIIRTPEEAVEFVNSIRRLSRAA
jgi:hypothetical protein